MKFSGLLKEFLCLRFDIFKNTFPQMFQDFHKFVVILLQCKKPWNKNLITLVNCILFIVLKYMEHFSFQN